ncbi:hypothetical protein NJF44_04315 [Pseudomonas guariconensis]|uniref:dermonecrotic toxin domain-containing protein n=1 Tax=Pseudomonas TaxID=286 RepID=UPI001CE454DC|nr:MULTISPECIES: DUF6543 domain-containing protein [Pseudomonas]MCO7639711.1 hypothetical protein [Pseudomonas sp. S 311-6]MCO7514407.1 hypothetical protein [Pseudomonas putida]MCO7565147.1 hypothetical protein [Pseudomonas mosselii]MCO7604460.1 hypothetical protein [Pseudomonas guariconensis]MCO7616491.1 hypothetical protein [Pseudomonas guariconensis]
MTHDSHLSFEPATTSFDVEDVGWRTAGRGNALATANQNRLRLATELRMLLQQAPRLRPTVRQVLQTHIQADPESCGLMHGDSQVTLLGFAARLLVSPSFANAFSAWSTWGFAQTSEYHRWSGADWITHLTPLIGTAHLHAQSNYWEGRMPGHAVSRRQQGQRLLHEHFVHSLDLAFALERIGAQAWDHGQLDENSQYALASWDHPANHRKISNHALLVKPRAGETRWLLYRPGANSAIRAFQHEPALLGWLFEHRKIIWPDTETLLAENADLTLISLQDIGANGFARMFDSTLADHQGLSMRRLVQAGPEGSTDPLDWSAFEAWEEKRAEWMRKDLANATEAEINQLIQADEHLAAQEVHFDSLAPRLPFGWRRQRVERQEDLLAGYLDGASTPQSAKLTELRTLQSTLERQRVELAQLFDKLPPTLTPQVWSERHGDTSRFSHISQHLGQGLLLEARLQQRLGELTQAQLTWTQYVVEQPEPSYLRPVETSALMLTLGGRNFYLTGYLTLQGIPSDQEQTPETSILLYKPGEDGGLKAFANPEQLFQGLLDTLQGAWPDALLDSTWPHEPATVLQLLETSTPAISQVPVGTHFFDYCVQTLLSALHSENTPASAAHHEIFRQRLGISTNMARLLAFERLAERNRTAEIHTQLSPKVRLDASQAARLAKQLEALRQAMFATHQLMSRDLPERARFARAAMHKRVRQDFNLTEVPKITLNMADHVFQEREPIPGSGQGHAQKIVYRFSEQRSDITLETFLLWAADDHMAMRLTNAHLRLTGPDETPVHIEGLDLTYIANLAKELDLAGAYERLILQAFKGLEGETDWETARRQELLRAPFEHRLRIIALGQQTLDTQGQALLERFAQEQLTLAAARTVKHRSLVLRPGTAPDGSRTDVELSGASLLYAETGPVLLLLPDAPNGKVVSQYTTSQLAIEALQTMALEQDMRTYLAELPVDGKASDHLAYLNAALLAKVSGFIGVGLVRNESLPQLHASLEMGRLIRRHRTSSRSQSDLYLETEAMLHGQIYDYIKLALGFVPGVGLAVGLYDGWSAANAAVAAFMRGDPRQGVEHLNSVFLSLIDALFDLWPMAAPTSGAALARARTLQRQRQSGFHVTSLPRMEHSNPFTGYAIDAPSGRWSDHPQPWGSGVHRHVESGQDYIAHQGQLYPVEWDASHHTWRLKGNATRSYKQPVRLNGEGVWQSHGSVSGRIVDAGLAGGGAYLSTLYNRGLETVRGYLRPRPAIQSPRAILTEMHRTRQHFHRTLPETMENYNRVRGVTRDGITGSRADAATIDRALTRAVDQLLEFVDFNERSLERLQTLRRQIDRRSYQAIADEFKYDLRKQHSKLISLQRQQMQNYFRELARLEGLTDQLTETAVKAHMTALRNNAQQLVLVLQKLEAEFVRYARVRNHLRGADLTAYDQDIMKLEMPLNPAGYQIVRVSAQVALLVKPAPFSYESLLFLRRFNPHVRDLRTSLFSQGDLDLAVMSRSQERRALHQFKEQYQSFINQTRIWEDTYGDFIDTAAAAQVRDALQDLIAKIEQGLGTPATSARPASNRGQSRPRVFETDDHQVFIGHERVVNGESAMEVSHNLNGQPHARYTRTEQGTWRATHHDRRMPSVPTKALETAAKRLLKNVPAQHAKLQHYQVLNMRPLDLQSMAEGYASNLRKGADDMVRQIGEALSEAQSALVQRLRQAADELDALGLRLRLQQTKATQQPTVDHLTYLVDQKAVKVRWSRELVPARSSKGKPLEYLEEYRVDDSITGEALWYVHFHFEQRPVQGFARLKAGHIKVASERNLGAGSGAWRGPVSEAQANLLFEGLRPSAR